MRNSLISWQATLSYRMIPSTEIVWGYYRDVDFQNSSQYFTPLETLLLQSHCRPVRGSTE